MPWRIVAVLSATVPIAYPGTSTNWTMGMLKISQNFKCRVIFWLPAASSAPAFTSQFREIIPTGLPQIRANPTIAVVPHRAPISNQESRSTTVVIILRGSYILALRRGMIVLSSAQERSAGSEGEMVGAKEEPELGR